MLKDLNFSHEDFPKEEVVKIIMSSEKNICRDYSLLFFEFAKETQISEFFFIFLGAITSLYFHLDDKNEPFKPLYTSPNSRTAIISDFTKDQLIEINKCIPDIEDCELKARIADIIWIRERDYKAAEIAISAYINSFNRLMENECYHESFFRIQRAFELSMYLGKKNKSFPEVVNEIEEILSNHNNFPNYIFISNILNLLLENHTINPVENASLSGELAIVNEESFNWRMARVFWEIQSRWLQVQGDEESKNKSLVLAAATYEKEIEEALSQNNNIKAINLLQNSIEAYKKIPNQQEKKDLAYIKLLELQKGNELNFMEYSETIDLTESALAAQANISGKEFEEAIRILAFGINPPFVENIKKYTVENMGNSILSLITQVNIDSEGKIRARRPGYDLNNDEKNKGLLTANMFSNAILEQDFRVAGYIEPCRKKISDEHYIEMKNLSYRVNNNPFVPSGYENIFKLGLYKGFIGDFVSSIHLLIPQIENSLRHILKISGVITSALTNEQIQQDFTLGKILYIDELKEIIGHDMVFDLQGLLIEEFGTNLRNRISHGLMTYNEMFALRSEYFWWIMLRFCLLPIIQNANIKEERNLRYLRVIT